MAKSKHLSDEQIKELIKMYPDYTNFELQHYFNITPYSIQGYSRRLNLVKSAGLTRGVSNQRNEELKKKLKIGKNRIHKMDLGSEGSIPWVTISTGNIIKRVGHITLHKGI